MMLQHVLLPKHVAENRCCLIDYRNERDAVDDPFHVVRLGMIKREAERGQRFAAAGRHAKREYPARQSSFAPRVPKNFGTQGAKWAAGGASRHIGHVRIETGYEAVNGR